MKIGDTALENKLVMAPLAGITNLPFRLMVKEAGCGLVYSEMVSAHGLVYESKKTHAIMDNVLEEKPLTIQIFGAVPDVMAEAAKVVEARGADIIDINFGCSVRKIVKSGSGAALLKTPDTAEKVITAVRKAVKIPLTIKLRSGWDHSEYQSFEISKMAEACGVDAIAVHPRTASQAFGGKSDWSIIRKIKENASIPIIGNGDILTPDDALQMFAETGCDGVMIGRAAIGAPWIFSQVLERMEGKPATPVTTERREKAMIRYLKDSVAYHGEKKACFMMRSRLCWFVKGLPNNRYFREAIKLVSSQDEAIDIIRKFLK